MKTFLVSATLLLCSAIVFAQTNVVESHANLDTVPTSLKGSGNQPISSQPLTNQPTPAPMTNPTNNPTSNQTTPVPVYTQPVAPAGNNPALGNSTGTNPPINSQPNLN